MDSPVQAQKQNSLRLVNTISNLKKVKCIKVGYPIWNINSREVAKQNLSLHDAGDRASDYLKAADFKNMQLLESTQYDNIGIYDFVAVQNNIRIYPESIKIKVALDNGNIVGLSAGEYLQSHFERKLSILGISVKQAREKSNPNLKIMEGRKAIITNDLNQDVLCYEFLGFIGEVTFWIFINAKNGKKEKS